VVEACSGIRSLVTLITLAVILVYFSRTQGGEAANEIGLPFYKNPDFWRGAFLMAFAVPIALITNAARVLITGVATYFYGATVLDSWWHDAFGWLTFLFAFVLLLLANSVARNYVANRHVYPLSDQASSENRLVRTSYRHVIVLLAILLTGGILINWLQVRTETAVERSPLEGFPVRLGEAFRPSGDKRFSPATEDVLRASDYVMRDYIDPPRRFNLYIGYYTSQRTGATYHSPQNCLPGSGWVMSDGINVEIMSPGGRRILANRYVVQNSKSRHIMIYWYQGRGRTTASEYWDKLYTVVDSVTRGRSDGSIVRIMTPVYAGENDEIAFNAAKVLSGDVADSLSAFVPD
jgi:EpsI family protein